MGRNIQSRKNKQRPNNKSIKFQQQPTKFIKQAQPFPRRQQFLLNLTKTKKETSNNKNPKANKFPKFSNTFSRQNPFLKHTKTKPRIFRQYRR